jgi:hypothetical protein
VFDVVGAPGERLVWRDILVEGPLGESGTAESRAHYLAARFGIDADAYAREFTDSRAALAAATTHDEVVLWFEQDLFCGFNLCFLLDRLARRPPARLTIVWTAEPLATLDADRLRDAYAARVEPDAAALRAAATAWQAFTSDDPRALLSADVDGLPFLREALRRHLGRFPAMTNGLDEIETAALRVLREGPLEFRDLFARVTATPPIRRHGMGDVQLAGDLGALTTGDTPLLARDGTAWRLTEAGRATLDSRRDRIVALGIDRWLGGVRVHGRGPVWRFDETHGALVQR